jgi:hypothetical protein
MKYRIEISSVAAAEGDGEKISPENLTNQRIIGMWKKFLGYAIAAALFVVLATATIFFVDIFWSTTIVKAENCVSDRMYL